MSDPKKGANRKIPNDGKGRPKGALNKTTVAVKEAHLMAFEGSGGVEAFTKWAKENRSDFYKLYSRLLPLDIQAKVGVGTLQEMIEESMK